MANVASTCLGVGLTSALGPRLFAAGGNNPLKQAATAKRVIYLYMNGGMSHLDTFDVKPGAETTIDTQCQSGPKSVGGNQAVHRRKSNLAHEAQKHRDKHDQQERPVR